MIDVEPSDGYLCSWCGEPVDKIKKPEHPAEQIVGTCEDDGIVYVKTEGEVSVA